MNTKSKLVFAALAAAILVVGAVVFLQQAPKTDGRKTACIVALDSSVNTLDPMRATEVFSGRVVTQIYEGLVGLDADNRIVPVLAESFTPNNDHTVWTFKIRPGVQFHRNPAIANGEARSVTAKDAAFCLTRLLSKESPFAFTLLDVVKGAPEYNGEKSDAVAGITAVDDLTLRVELVVSDPSFPSRMTSQVFGIYPPDAAQLGPDRFGTEVAVGTGPFMLVGNRRDDNVQLKRNPDYWQKLPGNIQNLEFRVIQNNALRLADVRNRHVNLAWLQSEQMRDVFTEESLRSRSFTLRDEWARNFAIQRFDTFNTHFLALNNERLDENFRRAVSFAIDRNRIVDAVTFGSAKVAPGPLPLAMHGYQPAYPGDIFNIETAKAVLAASKFQPATDSLEILVHDREGARAIGELIQNQLQPLGIRVQLVELDFNEAVSRIIQGNYSGMIMFLEYVFSTPLPILDNFFLPGKFPNFWRYNNPQFTERVLAMRKTPDPAAVNSEARELEKILVDQAASAFLFQRQNVLIHDKRLFGVLLDGHSMLHLGSAKMEP